jgi:chemotaxis methyl-accepting protein methylase
MQVMTRELARPPLSHGSPDYRHLLFRASAHRRHTIALRAPVADPDDAGIGDEEHSFLRCLFREAGLDAQRYQLRTLRRRVPACLRVLRATSFAEARRALLSTPTLRARALSTLIIGVTSFFRDAAVFQSLRDELLPPLLSSRLGVAAWSIGCSDGPELYSLAMLLDGLGFLGRSHLLGTDCRADAVRKARHGLYDSHTLRGVDHDLLALYFQRLGPDQWRISPCLRSAVHWRTADVLSLREPGLWDIILCRNMGMYLVPDAAADLWQRLESSLRPGGLLVLGKAERPNGARHLSPAGPCVYRRTHG